LFTVLHFGAYISEFSAVLAIGCCHTKCLYLKKPSLCRQMRHMLEKTQLPEPWVCLCY